mmetsp:Transcript_57344/g.129924  ORF Transcript_57344/g.129924 Transcript_57344/m.129924 type:complete len:95 (-) Transcript_57344:684-968(-)
MRACDSILLAFAFIGFARADEHENCAGWAASGECTQNPGYMLQSCKKSCATAFQPEGPPPNSFYEIVETDIDGGALDFSQFKGKVVLVTNVASE